MPAHVLQQLPGELSAAVPARHRLSRLQAHHDAAEPRCAGAAERLPHRAAARHPGQPAAADDAVPAGVARAGRPAVGGRLGEQTLQRVRERKPRVGGPVALSAVPDVLLRGVHHAAAQHQRVVRVSHAHRFDGGWRRGVAAVRDARRPAGALRVPAVRRGALYAVRAAPRPESSPRRDREQRQRRPAAHATAQAASRRQRAAGGAADAREVPVDRSRQPAGGAAGGDGGDRHADERPVGSGADARGRADSRREETSGETPDRSRLGPTGRHPLSGEWNHAAVQRSKRSG